MTEAEKLKREIDTLNELIRLSWLEMASRALSSEERIGVRQSINACIETLKDLFHRLDKASN